jgi:hypothetical protein
MTEMRGVGVASIKGDVGQVAVRMHHIVQQVSSTLPSAKTPKWSTNFLFKKMQEARKRKMRHGSVLFGDRWCRGVLLDTT